MSPVTWLRVRSRTARAAGAALLTAALLLGCSSDGPDRTTSSSPDTSAPQPDAPPDASPDAPSGDADELVTPDVVVDGDTLVLVEDGRRRPLATVGDDEELLHALVRPGDLDPITVLALTRAEDRYELRYVNVVGDEISDLFGFPWRLQVSDGVVAVADVPTLPVWAPDGSALAWIEWDGDGTVLRTVEWMDHDVGANPSDAQEAYRLGDVPVGSQLEAWELDDDGTPLLRARGDGDDVWRIRIEDGDPIAALDGAV